MRVGFVPLMIKALGSPVQPIFHSLYCPLRLYLTILNIRILWETMSKASIKLSTVHCLTLLHIGSGLIVETIGLGRYDFL